MVELCDGLLEIENAAFQYCKSLKQISVPSTVTQIQNRAFSDCKQLEELALFDGLQTIGNEAFLHCNLLKRLRIPNTVRSIESLAFCHAYQLRHLRLPEGIESIGAFTFSHIGMRAFYQCMSLKKIEIPSTVIRIGEWAFAYIPLVNIRLPDCLESLGEYAVASCKFSILRIPPLITTIRSGLVESCEGLMSIELSESVTRIEFTLSCKSLRNVAIPHEVDLSIEWYNNAFCICDDLKQVFTHDNMINALKDRFNNLPIHKLIYYQSYNNMTVDQLNNATSIRISRRRSKLDPSGSQQDCLGMTPLHIMTCSTVQNIEMYKVLVTKYPGNLVIKDRWGAVPLLYAVWGDAPDEIVQFLVESYKSLYPDHAFNWTEMMVTLCKARVPNNVIRTLIDLHNEFVPNQMEQWIEELAENEHISKITFHILIQCGFTERVNAIGLIPLRIKLMRETMNLLKKYVLGSGSKVDWLDRVRSELVNYEEECKRLKAGTTILELALWKYKMEESDTKKKRKWTYGSDSDFREQCRVGCSADIVIEHVLPFLVPRYE